LQELHGHARGRRRVVGSVCAGGVEIFHALKNRAQKQWRLDGPSATKGGFDAELAIETKKRSRSSEHRCRGYKPSSKEHRARPRLQRVLTTQGQRQLRLQGIGQSPRTLPATARVLEGRGWKKKISHRSIEDAHGGRRLGGLEILTQSVGSKSSKNRIRLLVTTSFHQHRAASPAGVRKASQRLSSSW